MYPDLIDLGFLHLKTYGAFMALGFLAAWQVVAWLCRRMGRDPEPCTNLIMWMMVSGVAGSRIAYVIEHWSQEFAGHPELLVRIDQGGLMFYGGFILALAVFVVWCRVKREPIVPMADLFPLGGWAAFSTAAATAASRSALARFPSRAARRPGTSSSARASSRPRPPPRCPSSPPSFSRRLRSLFFLRRFCFCTAASGIGCRDLLPDPIWPDMPAFAS